MNEKEENNIIDDLVNTYIELGQRKVNNLGIANAINIQIASAARLLLFHMQLAEQLGANKNKPIRDWMMSVLDEEKPYVDNIASTKVIIPNLH